MERTDMPRSTSIITPMISLKRWSPKNITTIRNDGRIQAPTDPVR